MECIYRSVSYPFYDNDPLKNATFHHIIPNDEPPNVLYDLVEFNVEAPNLGND
jgi:hypothetical protein